MREIASLLVLQAVTRVHHERQPSLQEQILKEEPMNGERNYPVGKGKKKGEKLSESIHAATPESFLPQYIWYFIPN